MNFQELFKNFLEHLRAHGVRTFATMVTGYFTYYAGYKLTGDPVYGATLVLLSEGLALWYPYILESAQSVGTLKKLNIGGLSQWTAALLGIAFSWGSIVLTDVSSATLIAKEANMKIFTLFAEIPQWSQQVIVYILPVSAFVNITLLTIFYVCSPEAAQARRLRAIRRDADNAIRLANAEAEQARAEEEANEYKAKASEAAKKAGRAAAQARLAKDFAEVLTEGENPPSGNGMSKR